MTRNGGRIETKAAGFSGLDGQGIKEGKVVIEK